MAGAALIIGASGQDGAYLAGQLHARAIETYGTTRGDAADAQVRLAKAVPGTDIGFHRLDPADGAATAGLIERLRPARIYYLAAQSSVWRSFEDPAETVRSSVIGLYSVLEAMRDKAPDARLVYAASGDCFGVTTAQHPATETTRMAPRSPYAVAKCAGVHAIAAARRAYGTYACSAFLFSHESPLRGPDFVTAKIAGAVQRIAAGSQELLELGTISVVRDWGWAPDYTVALDRMLDPDLPQDMVIASGESHSLEELVAAMFAAVGRDWRDHVRVGRTAARPADIAHQYADPTRARELLGWRTTVDFEELARRLVHAREAG